MAATEDREGLGGQLRQRVRSGSTEELIGCIVININLHRLDMGTFADRDVGLRLNIQLEPVDSIQY